MLMATTLACSKPFRIPVPRIGMARNRPVSQYKEGLRKEIKGDRQCKKNSIFGESEDDHTPEST